MGPAPACLMASFPELGFLWPSALSFSFYPYGRTGLSVGCCAPGGFRPLQNSQTRSGASASTCRRCTFRRAGDGVGTGLTFPLGSRLPWPTTSQALAHFLSAGNSQADS